MKKDDERKNIRLHGVDGFYQPKNDFCFTSCETVVKENLQVNKENS